jgi:methanesulfonate monooxygenase small subunit
VEPDDGPARQQSLQSQLGWAFLFSDQAIREVIYRACLALDAEEFETFMALCSPDFNYRLTVFSPEIRKDMTWLEQDYAGMKALLEMVPQHMTRPGSLKRHVSVYLIDRDGETATVTSSFIVIATDGNGKSSVFVTGNYYDDIDCSGDQPLLRSRRAHLETRDLGTGTHMPI